MSVGIYSKLAWDGVRKNKRLYTPYLLTGAVMVMMYYIVSFLGATQMLQHMKGGGILRTMLPMGAVVIGVFSFIFLFYSNSLILRQRNREFGLYNILGMDKGNLGRIMLWENLIVAAIAIVCGLILGIGLSKLAELGMLNLLNEEIVYEFQLDLHTAKDTAVLFLGIYFILLLNSVIKVRCSKPIELLHSSNVGEKPPKANWLFAVVGVVMLAVAYYIAVSIEQPLSALVWFLVAVILVIVATYFLFVSGSVAFCRILQRNKKYYYKPQHFVSVASMTYRMKRNGAGLASICILVTMVLVMLSATISLYVGAEDSLALRYPKDIALRLTIPDIDLFHEDSFSYMRQAICDRVPRREEVVEYTNGDITCVFTDEGMLVDTDTYMEINLTAYENIGILSIIPLEDYNRIMGTNKTLEQDECLLYCVRTDYIGSTFSIQHGLTLRVKEVLDEMYVSGYAAMQIVPTIVLVTADFQSVIEPLLPLADFLGDPLLQLCWNYSFNMDATWEEEIAAYDLLQGDMSDIVIRDEDGSYSYSLDGRAAGRTEFFGLYGGLFLIGILLSIVLLFAAVVIIYYKQISEGFEDQKRFEVMKKVGMTRKDIRKSVNSQILTVFFMPLLFAGLHLTFAFPIVWRLLQMFNFSNLPLMILVTLVCFLIFAGVYTMVYKITSNAYFSIVNGAKTMLQCQK